MKRLFLLLAALITQHVAVSGEEPPKPRTPTRLQDLEELVRRLDEIIVKSKEEEGRLVARLAASPPDSDEAQRLQMKLEKVRELILREPETLSKLTLFLKEATASVSVSAAIDSDHRRPTKSDLSGAWFSGPNLGGYTIQIEQTGASILGQGYHWGCLGIYNSFKIRGTYRQSRLTLTFDESPDKQTTRVFHYKEENGRPKFQTSDPQQPATLAPLEDRRILLQTQERSKP